MKSYKSSLLIGFIFLFTLAASVEAQVENDGKHNLETLRTALVAGRYLDAYNEVFTLYDSAPKELVEALVARPKSEADQQVHIFLALFAGQPQLAINENEDLPESPFSLVVEVAANTILENGDDTAKTFASALERVKDKAQFYGVIAAAAFVAGNPDAILANSSHAIELDPKLASAYRLRGISKLYSGEPKAAIEDADYAIKLDPSIYFFHYLRANSHFALGDVKAVIDNVDAALAMNPNSFIGNAMRANANLALNNASQAAYDFNVAVEARTNELVNDQALIPAKPLPLTMAFGRTYHLPLKAEAGQTLNVNVTSTNPGVVDPDLLLLGPDGQPLVFNDDAGDDTIDAGITEYELPDSGMYTVVVSHANGGSEGDIEVLVSLK